LVGIAYIASAIYNRKCAYLSFKNWTPPHLTNALWPMVFVPSLAIEKEEIETFCEHHAHWYQIFSLRNLWILVRCKTKGAVGAVCALLRI
jgi:hypothetical protein